MVYISGPPLRDCSRHACLTFSSLHLPHSYTVNQLPTSSLLPNQSPATKMKLITTISLLLYTASQVAAVSKWLDATIAHTGDPIGEEIDDDGCKFPYNIFFPIQI